MRHFVRLFGQSLVVIVARGFGVQGQVELVFPTELKPGAGQRIIADLRGWVAFGQVRGMGRELVGNHADFDIITIRQAEVLFRGDIAKHGGAEPANHRRANAGGDVIIARRNVGCEWPQRIERRFAAFFQLLVHIHFDLVHRHMAGALNHHLTAARMGDLSELAKRFQLGKLRRIIGICD